MEEIVLLTRKNSQTLTWTKNNFKCVWVFTHFGFVIAASTPLNNTEPPVLKSFVSTLKLDTHLKISYMYFYKIFSLIEHSKSSERPQFSLRD